MSALLLALGAALAARAQDQAAVPPEGPDDLPFEVAVARWTQALVSDRQRERRLATERLIALGINATPAEQEQLRAALHAQLAAHEPDRDLELRCARIFEATGIWRRDPRSVRERVERAFRELDQANPVDWNERQRVRLELPGAPRLREAAAAAREFPAVALMLIDEALGSEHLLRVRAMLFLLPVLPGADAAPRAVRALAHADPLVRACALAALAEVGTEEHLPAVLARGADPDETVRLAALLAAATFPDARIIGLFLDRLLDAALDVRFAAGYYLERLSGHAERFNAWWPDERRRAAVIRWRAWWAVHETGFVIDATVIPPRRRP